MFHCKIFSSFLCFAILWSTTSAKGKEFCSDGSEPLATCKTILINIGVEPRYVSVYQCGLKRVDSNQIMILSCQIDFESWYYFGHSDHPYLEMVDQYNCNGEQCTKVDTRRGFTNEEIVAFDQKAAAHGHDVVESDRDSSVSDLDVATSDQGVVAYHPDLDAHHRDAAASDSSGIAKPRCTGCF